MFPDSMKYLALLALLLTSCATDTGNAEKDRRGRTANAVLETAVRAIGRFSVSAIQNAVAQKMSGADVDWNAAASQGLWTTAPTLVSSADVNRAVEAWAGPQAPAIKSAIAPQLAAAQSPEQVQAVAVSAAAGLDRVSK